MCYFRRNRKNLQRSMMKKLQKFNAKRWGIMLIVDALFVSLIQLLCFIEVNNLNTNILLQQSWWSSVAEREGGHILEQICLRSRARMMNSIILSISVIQLVQISRNGILLASPAKGLRTSSTKVRFIGTIFSWKGMFCCWWKIRFSETTALDAHNVEVHHDDSSVKPEDLTLYKELTRNLPRFKTMTQRNF